MTIPMLYLIFIRLTGWMALLARSAASKDAELRCCARTWRCCGGRTPSPKLNWADRMVAGS